MESSKNVKHDRRSKGNPDNQQLTNHDYANESQTKEVLFSEQDTYSNAKLLEDFKLLKQEYLKLKKDLDIYKFTISSLKDFLKSRKKRKPLSIDIGQIRKDVMTKELMDNISTVVLFSDWHIGERITSYEVNNVNFFNSSIAKFRLKKLVDKLLSWSINCGSFNELVIICLGDIISGDIHYELDVTNEYCIPVQIVEAAELLADVITQFSRVFKNVRVEFIVTDNHSRRTPKIQYKNSSVNSYNFLIGYICKEKIEQIKNVEFKIHLTAKALVDVQGYKFLCSHGNFLKSWLGIPYYALEREIARESKFRMDHPELNFYKIIIGHFHVPMYGYKYIINGSLSGTNEYDYVHGRYCYPCQVGFLVHKKYGDMNFVSFNLDK